VACLARTLSGNYLISRRIEAIGRRAMRVAQWARERASGREIGRWKLNHLLCERSSQRMTLAKRCNLRAVHARSHASLRFPSRNLGAVSCCTPQGGERGKCAGALVVGMLSVPSGHLCLQ
jgi:hypothetical protein